MNHYPEVGVGFLEERKVGGCKRLKLGRVLVTWLVFHLLFLCAPIAPEHATILGFNDKAAVIEQVNYMTRFPKL